MRFAIQLVRQLPRCRVSVAYDAIRSALMAEGARIRREHPPQWIVAVHGGGLATPEWHRTAKKQLVFYIVPDDDGPFVFVDAVAPLLGNRAIRARESEARKNWGALLDDLWKSTLLQLAGTGGSPMVRSQGRSSFQKSRSLMQVGGLVFLLAASFTVCRLSDLSGATVKEGFEILAHAAIGATFAAGGLAALIAGNINRIRADAMQAEYRRLSRLAYLNRGG